MENNAAKRKQLFGHLTSIVCVIVWGSTMISTKIILRIYTPEEILLIRFILGYLTLWIMFPKKEKLNSKKEELLCLLCGITGVFMYFYLQNVSLLYTAAADVSIIMALSPMFTAIFSYCFYKKYPGKHFGLGFIVSIIGIIMVIFNGTVSFEGSVKGNLIALVAAVVWGLYSAIMTRLDGYPVLLITRKVFFYGLLTMCPLIVVNGCSLHMDKLFESCYIGNLLYLGCVSSAICFLIWNNSVKVLGAVKTSLYSYAIPVATIFFAVIFLGEILSVSGGIGAVIAIVGMIISQK